MEFLEKRDKFIQALKDCGMKPVVPDGGYFVLADYSQIGSFEQIKVLFRNLSINLFVSSWW